ncbi:unnamed protein product [Rotaria sp. Silwood2]|nr:unnamed protein product [Rotaria sp. Silwood2]CAF3272604.1 unnamed protein product [Rotaria sp. Silwood2]CAF3540850.1 unnamed protein product [Rotaria sp. Silwood2]CAF4588212.1 unnamed protein product [Rotaria sp. Silwood2]CAF4690168.1 unnamed protein product [Rotaria sp. Silwood2]
MSKLATSSSENEPFISQPTETTIIPIKGSTVDVQHSSNSVIISNEQFQELLSRIGNLTRTQSGIANPGALGLAAFALTTFILSVFNAGSYLINVKLEPVVLPVALFYGGLAQFLAGMWEFKLNNVFGATAFTSYGGFWMSFAGYVHLILPKIKQVGNAKKATGLFLLAWFIFTLIMNVAALRTSKFLFILFTILNITFLFLIIGNLADLTLFVNIGGWFGIITAFIAWYGSAAILINSTFKKSLLPLGVFP